MPPGPPGPPAQGRALRPLELGAAALLPASVVREVPLAPGLRGLPAGGDLDPVHSWSLGTPSRGWLVGSRALPLHDPVLKPRPISLRRDATYGTEAVVQALVRAAGAVGKRWPGSVVWAGDLSAPGGGAIPHHKSHRSGRDVDLSLHYRDDAGRMADRPDFLAVNHAGQTADGRLSFDAERTWTLVQALVRDPQVDVQWIFVASWLETLLLAAGERQGADPRVLERAAAVMKQPGDSAPHAEHLHVRIYCGEAELMEGCVDPPPRHPWTDDHAESLERRVAALLPLVRTGRTEEVRYAVSRLVRMNATAAIPDLDALTERTDIDPEVASLATDAAAFLRGTGSRPEWAAFEAEEVGE